MSRVADLPRVDRFLLEVEVADGVDHDGEVVLQPRVELADREVAAGDGDIKMVVDRRRRTECTVEGELEGVAGQRHPEHGGPR